MAACVVHKGPYETLNLAYSAIMKWIEDNNYSIIAPEREVYLQGVDSTANPDDYITEIQFPIQKGNSSGCGVKCRSLLYISILLYKYQCPFSYIYYNIPASEADKVIRIV